MSAARRVNVTFIPLVLVSLLLVPSCTVQRPPNISVTPSPAQNLADSSSSTEKNMYENTTFGFSVEYPKDWIAKERTATYYKEEFSVAFRPAADEVGDPDYGVVSVAIYKTTEDIDSFISELCHSPGDCASPQNAVSMTVAGLPAKKVINPPGPIESEEVIFKQGNRVYLVTSFASAQQQKYFDDILASFALRDK